MRIGVKPLAVEHETSLVNSIRSNDSKLTRVLESNNGSKKHKVKEGGRGHRCLGNSTGYPAEAVYMDLNPRIDMFRHLTHNIQGGGPLSNETSSNCGKRNHELTDDSIEVNHSLKDRADLKPPLSNTNNTSVSSSQHPQNKPHYVSILCEPDDNIAQNTNYKFLQPKPVPKLQLSKASKINKAVFTKGNSSCDPSYCSNSSR